MPTEMLKTAVCVGCGYSLRGLPDPVCPECGRTFVPSDPSTYRARPGHARKWRRVALISGLVLSSGLLLVMLNVMWERCATCYATELCEICGVQRKSSHYEILGHQAQTTSAILSNTGVSEFLSEFVDTHEHCWSPVSTRSVSWKSQRLSCAVHHSGRARLMECRFSPEELRSIMETMPDLPERIQEDILGNPNEIRALQSSNTLKLMRGCPIPAVRMLMKQDWDRRRSYDWMP